MMRAYLSSGSAWSAVNDMLLNEPAFPGLENFLLLLAVGRRFGEGHFQCGSVNDGAVQFGHGVHGVLALFEVNERIVLHLLDPLNGAVQLERLLQLLLAEILRQIPHVQHFHLQRPIPPQTNEKKYAN